MLSLSPADEARFWAKVVPVGDCLLWVAGVDSHGYGQFSCQQRTYLAHRVAWLLTQGFWPGGQEVCHTCDTPACVNPNHLFLGSHADNMRDRELKGRAKRPRGAAHHSRRDPSCMARGDQNGARRHPEALARGEANASAKLTAQQVQQLRELYATGTYKQKDLAKLFGINQPHVSRVIRGEVWQHV